MPSRIDELIAFLAETPNDPFLKYALTMEYRKQGDKEKTLTGFLDLTTNHPDYVGTYYHYAKYLEELKQLDDALGVYRTGMEVAQRMRNRHALGELTAAYNLARGLDEDDWDE